MPSWNEVLNQMKENSNIDVIRRKYLKDLSKHTGRNTIAYYSGWLQKPGEKRCQINDEDINGFMTTIYELNRDKGVDLILHTPGGVISATESIVDYLRKMFNSDIRIIVPLLAMSGGTMIACSGKVIIMGKHSSLGPIDPQFNGISAEGVIEEFNRAIEEIKRDPASLPIWQTIISRYHPTFIGDCEKAIRWSKQIATKWLRTGMFKGESADKKITGIVNKLSSHKETSTHSRHLPVDVCEKIGLKIERLENLGDKMQDLVLTVHHCFMHTFSSTPSVKIIENQKGRAIVMMARGK